MTVYRSRSFALTAFPALFHMDGREKPALLFDESPSPVRTSFRSGGATNTGYAVAPTAQQTPLTSPTTASLPRDMRGSH